MLTRQPSRRNSQPCPKKQTCRPQFWLWTLKKPCDLVPTPPATVWSQSYPIRDLPSDLLGALPGTWRESHPSERLVTGTKSADNEVDTCPTANSTDQDPGGSFIHPGARVHAYLNCWYRPANRGLYCGPRSSHVTWCQSHSTAILETIPSAWEPNWKKLFSAETSLQRLEEVFAPSNAQPPMQGCEDYEK